MKRTTIALLASLTMLLSAGPGSTDLGVATARGAQADPCYEHCGNRAAEHCDDVHSLRCAFYIFGCLAGCRLAMLED